MSLHCIHGPYAACSNAASSKQSSIRIIIANHYSCKVYNTGSAIVGTVNVQTASNVAFDRFDIVLSGIATTCTEYVSQNPRHTFQPFLRLRMPVDINHLPCDQVFEAKRVYTIPFHFVVPDRLAQNACYHNCETEILRDFHLSLPPTIGFWDADDKAPSNVARVEYAIKAQALILQPGGGYSAMLRSHHMLKILPSSLPFGFVKSVKPCDERYVLSQTKKIRSSLFGHNTGKVTISGAQPASIILTADGRCSSSSTAHVKLEFVKHDVHSSLPSVSLSTTKLDSTTFCSSSPLKCFPDLGSRTHRNSTNFHTFCTSTRITTDAVTDTKWTKNIVSYPFLEQLGNSEDKDVKGSDMEGSQVVYERTLSIRFRLIHTNKTATLPSFYSCLLSRTYSLKLVLAIGSPSTHLALTLPLTIVVEGPIPEQAHSLEDCSGHSTLPSYVESLEY